jgi:hypothetical protein
MHTCACGEAFACTDDLESHLIDMSTPETDTGNSGQDHYEVATPETAHDSGDTLNEGVRM